MAWQPYIQFHTMVAKINQSSRRDPHIIWNQMLLRKCSIKSTCCRLSIGKEFTDFILELDYHYKEIYFSMELGN